MPDEGGQHADRIGVSPEGSSAETRSGAEVPRGGPVEDDRPDPRPSTGGVAPRRLLIAATHEDLSEHLEAIKERISARSRDGTAIELAEILDGDAPDDAPGRIGVADADIFMAIVAWRYGAIPPEHDRSIIQSAYEEVVRQGKPRLIFLAAPGTEYQTDAQALFPAVVRDEGNLWSLQSLRAQLQRERGVAYFTTPEDLAAKVDAALRGMLDLAPDAPHGMVNLGAALNNLGDLAVEARQWEDAERYYNDAVGIFSETSAPSSAVAVLLRLGRLAHAHRSNKTEFAAYRRALSALRQLDDRPALAFVLRRLGALALTGGKKKQAAQYCEESLALHRELKDRRGTAITLSCLGTLNARNKRFADAIAHCTASLSLFEALQMADYAQTVRLDLVELEAALEAAQADPSGAALAFSPAGSASAVAANEWGEHDDEDEDDEETGERDADEDEDEDQTDQDEDEQDGEGGSESGETLSADDVAPERRQQLMADFERNTDLGKPPYARTVFIMPQEIEWVIGERGWDGWRSAVDLRNAVFAGLRLTDMKFEDADLAGADLTRADLSEVNLVDADLRGANLSAANLAKARLRDAWLQRANLSSANLQEANLRGARLQRANLSGANLQAARLRRARLQKANLSGANLQETRLGLVRLQRADLSGANLQRTRLRRARLQGANLSGAVLEKTMLEKARLRNTVLRQAQVTEINLSERRLRKLDLSGAVLTNVNLSGVNAPEITLHGAQGREVDLSRARLRQADLSGASFPGVNMDRARLRAANLRGVRLTGADLSGTRLQEADLRGADLRHSLMSPETLLDKIRFDNLVCLAGLRWNGVQLDGVDWDYVTALGDETLASKPMESRRERVAAIQEAMRAYHGVTVALRNQGINIPASRFRLREQRVEQKLLRMQGKVLPWLGSLLLDWMAGYGEALGRIFVTYLGVVLGFSGLYWWLTNHVLQHTAALQWYEAIALSFSTFHGRGFFTQTINLGETLGLLAVVEAVVGIFIEIILIAAFARRFLDG